MDAPAAKPAFIKGRRVEGIVRELVARHAVHITDTPKCMYGKSIPLANTIGPFLGGKVAYAVMLEAVGVA